MNDRAASVAKNALISRRAALTRVQAGNDQGIGPSNNSTRDAIFFEAGGY